MMNTKTVTIVSRWTDNFTYTVEVNAGEPAAMLEQAFAMTNRDNRPLGNKVCSTSVGDLLSVDGRRYVVEPCGFVEVTAEQAEAWKKLDSRDAHMGFNWVQQHQTELLNS